MSSSIIIFKLHQERETLISEKIPSLNFFFITKYYPFRDEDEKYIFF